MSSPLQPVLTSLITTTNHEAKLERKPKEEREKGEVAEEEEERKKERKRERNYIVGQDRISFPYFCILNICLYVNLVYCFESDLIEKYCFVNFLSKILVRSWKSSRKLQGSSISDEFSYEYTVGGSTWDIA